MRHPALPYVLPFAVVLAGLAATSAVTAGGFADTRVLYVLRAAAAGLVLVWACRRVAALRAVPAPRELALAFAVGAGVIALWLALDHPWARLGQAEGFNPYAGQDRLTGTLLAAARVLGAVLVAPLAEELFFRGWLQRRLVSPDFEAVAPARCGGYVLLVQAAIFALAHTEIIAAFITGVAYGALYRYSGKLWTAVAAHAVSNALLAAWVLGRGAWHLW